MGSYTPFPADGQRVAWQAWAGDEREDVELRWENEGWTVTTHLQQARVQYVMRYSASFDIRQFLLFRDLDEPDLWLATDGHGRWGEVNGVERNELHGATELHVVGALFAHTPALRHIAVEVGEQAEAIALLVDCDTLEVRRVLQRYRRLGPARWACTTNDDAIEFDVDQQALVHEVPGLARRAGG